MRARSKFPFLAGGAFVQIPCPRPSSVVDIKYEGSTRISHGTGQVPGGGPDAVGDRRQTESHDGRFVQQPSDVVPVSPNLGDVGLDWDQDESMTEEWSASKHAAPRPSEIRTMLGVGLPKRHGSSPDARTQSLVAPSRSEAILPAARVPDIEDDVEQLRERLIDALERARTSEGRAAQAERRVKEAESHAHSTLEPLRARLIEALERAQIGEARASQAERRAHEIESRAPVMAPLMASANASDTPNDEDVRQLLEPLQEQLVEALERARNSEARAAVAESAERHAQSLHTTARDALERLTDELVEAMDLARNNEAVALEAEQRAQSAERASYNVQAHWQHTEDQTTRVRERSSRLNLIWASIAVASVVVVGAGSYFVVYAPLNQRLAAAQALQRSESDRQAQELTSAKAAAEAQRQRFATERAGLESQLTAARETPVAPPPPEKAKRGNASEGSMDAATAAPHRWHRKTSDDGDDATPKHAAHERAAKADKADKVDKADKPSKADRDDSSEKPIKPAAKSSGGSDDPLDGL